MFWYDKETNQNVVVYVYQDELEIAKCNPNQYCRVQYPLPPPPTPDIPTLTPTLVASDTPTPTETPATPQPIVCAPDTLPITFAQIPGSSHVIFADPVSVACYNVFLQETLVSGKYDPTRPEWDDLKTHFVFQIWKESMENDPPFENTHNEPNEPYVGALWFGAAGYCRWAAVKFDIPAGRGRLPYDFEWTEAYQADLLGQREQIKGRLPGFVPYVREWLEPLSQPTNDQYPIVDWEDTVSGVVPQPTNVSAIEHQQLYTTFRCVFAR
jgi:hypothetical protein